MLEIIIGGAAAPVVAVPVYPDGEAARLGAEVAVGDLRAELELFLADVSHSGAAGVSHVLPRPGRVPASVLLVGVGSGDGAGWRSFGAAVVRSAARYPAVSVLVPVDARVEELAEGALLASYRFTLAPSAGKDGAGNDGAGNDGAGNDKAPKLAELRLPVSVDEAAVRRARAVAGAVGLARDLTNTPSLEKSPQWLVDQISAAAGHRRGLSVTVRDETELAEQGFGGILAVGASSPRPPRLLEVAWRPRGARTHVVLVGKGITFDTGGISIKPLDAMKLMRKDMGGAAAICATVLGAADLDLPVRITAVAPFAENMVSGSAMRPGDVIAHYGGLTTEILDTDAEGRLVLADALAYAVRRLKPDVVIDLATLTGASHIAVGKRLAALLTPSDPLAAALATAGEAAGERLWRLPLVDDYVAQLRSDVADLVNVPRPGTAGAVTAALFLREFVGEAVDRWAHIDMSAPAWVDSPDGPLARGATGWGVRMLLRYLSAL